MCFPLRQTGLFWGCVNDNRLLEVGNINDFWTNEHTANTVTQRHTFVCVLSLPC